MAATLIRQLEAFPPIHAGVDCGPKVRQLHELCLVALAHLPTNPELATPNMAQGQRPIWGKLPEGLPKLRPLQPLRQ